MKVHLAILYPGWIEQILNGSKTIESRFTKVRCAPFGKVHTGDTVFMKESGGLVKGMFTVAKVETFENLTNAQICDLFYKEYREQIFTPAVSAEMRQPPEKWLTAKHATLIHIADPVTFETPFRYPKRGQQAWVVLEQPLHKCQMCGERYLLEVYEGPDGERIHGSQDFCPLCYAEENMPFSEQIAMSERDWVIEA